MPSLEKLAATLGSKLAQRHIKLCTAESCTGGGLAYLLTSVAGSSAWFDRGFVTYSDASKIALVSVNPLTLERFGAVSKETASEMAEGALKNSEAAISVAITGIAGPEGGTAQKPVGTVWIAIAATGLDTSVNGYLFSGNRAEIRLATLEQALLSLLEE